MNTTVRPRLTLSALLMLAFIILLILKLTAVINWTWWLITLPIWIMPAGYGIMIILVTLMAILRVVRQLFIQKQ